MSVQIRLENSPEAFHDTLSRIDAHVKRGEIATVDDKGNLQFHKVSLKEKVRDLVGLRKEENAEVQKALKNYLELNESHVRGEFVKGNLPQLAKKIKKYIPPKEIPIALETADGKVKVNSAFLKKFPSFHPAVSNKPSRQVVDYLIDKDKGIGSSPTTLTVTEKKELLLHLINAGNTQLVAECLEEIADDITVADLRSKITTGPHKGETVLCVLTTAVSFKNKLNTVLKNCAQDLIADDLRVKSNKKNTSVLTALARSTVRGALSANHLKVILDNCHGDLTMDDLRAKYKGYYEFRDGFFRSDVSTLGLLLSDKIMSSTCRDSVLQLFTERATKDMTKDDLFLHVADTAVRVIDQLINGSRTLSCQTAIEELLGQTRLDTGWHIKFQGTWGPWGQKIQQLVFDREQFINALKSCEKKQKISNLKELQELADEATKSGYHNAYYELGQLLDTVDPDRAVAMYALVPSSSRFRTPEWIATMRQNCYDKAMEPGITNEAKSTFLNYSLTFALKHPDETMRNKWIQTIASSLTGKPEPVVPDEYLSFFHEKIGGSYNHQTSLLFWLSENTVKDPRAKLWWAVRGAGLGYMEPLYETLRELGDQITIEDVRFKMEAPNWPVKGTTVLWALARLQSLGNPDPLNWVLQKIGDQITADDLRNAPEGSGYNTVLYELVHCNNVPSNIWKACGDQITLEDLRSTGKSADAPTILLWLTYYARGNFGNTKQIIEQLLAEMPYVFSKEDLMSGGNCRMQLEMCDYEWGKKILKLIDVRNAFFETLEKCEKKPKKANFNELKKLADSATAAGYQNAYYDLGQLMHKSGIDPTEIYLLVPESSRHAASINFEMQQMHYTQAIDPATPKEERKELLEKSLTFALKLGDAALRDRCIQNIAFSYITEGERGLREMNLVPAAVVSLINAKKEVKFSFEQFDKIKENYH